MLKPIFKKQKEEPVQQSLKKVMLTDLCPQEKQRIGEMMILMEKQKVQNKDLRAQLKQLKEGKVIQDEKIEDVKLQNEKLQQRIRQIEEKYSKVCRQLEKQKEKISKIPIKPNTKNASTQSIDVSVRNTYIQTQVSEQKSQQSLMNQSLNQPTVNPSPTFKPNQANYIQMAMIPPLPTVSNRFDPTLTFQQLQNSLSKNKSEVSASKLAKQWIKTKKQKIKQMKKDILKSEREVAKQLQFIALQSSDQNNEESYSEEDSDSNNQKIKSLREYHRRLKQMKQEYEMGDRSKTEENVPVNLSSQRRSRIQRAGQLATKVPKIVNNSVNNVDIDDDALNRMLKSRDFRANDVLTRVKRSTSASKKSHHKQKYGSDLVDLIETLQK